MPQVNNFNKLLILKGFANYYDRKVFYYSSADDYDSAAADSMDLITDYNFNPNDGIDTKITIRSSDEMLLSCNYLLVLTNDDSEDIVSRWYIMDCVRQSKEIYEVTLRRDVVAEALGGSNFAYENPIYVERGMLSQDSYNPLLLTDEGMNLNKIKKAEYPLYDETNTPWIVAYFANNTLATTVQTGTRELPQEYLTLAQVADITGISQDTLEAMITGGAPIATSEIRMTWAYNTYALIRGFRRFEIKIANELDGYDERGWYPEFAWDYPMGKYNRYDGARLENTIFEAASNSIGELVLSTPEADIADMFTTLIGDQIPNEEFVNLPMYNKLLDLFNNRTVVLYQGQYYYLRPSYSGITDHTEIEAIRGQDTLMDQFIGLTDTIHYEVLGQGDETLTCEETYATGKVFINYKSATGIIELLPADPPGTTYNYKFKIETSHNILDDGGYSMLAMPLNSIPYINNNLDSVHWTNTQAEVMLQLATQLAKELSTNLIDIQILPYQPRIFLKYGGYKDGERVVNLDSLTADKDYAWITDALDNKVGLVFFEQKASFSFDIERIPVLENYDIKEEANTTSYRLCSPNYSGVFEFNTAKMGRPSYFAVDITYKPFNPFIRVTPEFQRLYGENYQDGRGLICGGDFSLPVVLDKWEEYENNNKLFSQIFSRDIQHLEFTQEQERFKEPFAVLSGTAVGAGMGAVAGAKATAGNPYGAAAGAVIGAGTGLAGGLIDLQLNEARRQEEKRYSIDRFNLSLASIKALPQSLTKGSVLTQIYKFVPFIEFYDCTEEEHEIFRNRIKYNGMIIGKIDYLINYVNPDGLAKDRDEYYYFKGQVIHAEAVNEDAHFVSVLYDEIAKGVYI